MPDEFEHFVYRACHVEEPDDPVAHWRGVRSELNRRAESLQGTRELRIVGPGTDLRLGLEGRSWTAADAPTTALAVIDACSEFWQRHRPLYRVAGLVADEGDPRFIEVRAATFADLTAAFRDEIAQWKERGKHPADVDPFATACVVVAMLIHTMARESAFGLAGVSPRSLRLHVARVLCATVTGDTVRL